MERTLTPILNKRLPGLNDIEGTAIPESLPFIIDSHVHIFPDPIFEAIWRWFDKHAWPIRYKLTSKKLLNFLFEHGLGHIVALQYAHKPGIARELNSYMAEICQEYHGQVTGMATVFPGEEGDIDILEKAFEKGLQGVKLHAHVQCFDLNCQEVNKIYNLCSSAQKPIIVHAGREPKSPAYNCDPYKLCRVDKLERVLIDFPELKVCVPHLGLDEISEYRELIEKYDNLWLDTAMAVTEYLPTEETIELDRYRLERIMYGSDFPNIPYAWDRELNCLHDLGLSHEKLGLILNKSASNFFNIHLESKK